MIIRRNMDELMDLDLPSGWIAAAHACACNPRKLAHYPEDWYVFPSTELPACAHRLPLGYLRIALTQPYPTQED